MDMRWNFKEQPNPILVKTLSESINVNSTLSSLLINRGIQNFEEARSFFRPSLDGLHDPFLMKDMRIAVDRLKKAIDLNQKILIYGDYDVDGTTSVAMVYSFLSDYSDKLSFYVPDRYSEGYGVSKKGIAWAIEHEIDLIISLDCGIRALDRVQEAKDAGIDFIICDHHHPGAELPPAIAILDPKQENCSYPYPELSGCGVGYKLLQGYSIEMDIPQERLFDYLDLVVVSIASDIVQITGENRILAHYGLKRLNSSPRAGIKALLDVSGSKGRQNISSIVFGIGPRINAAGRIDHAHRAIDLLISTDHSESKSFAARVNERNTERKDYDQNITREALEMIANNSELKEAKTTVLYKDDWHKGVIGIVASRCIEKYFRPTVILTESNEKATGSVRSVPGFDVYEAITKCEDLLEQYGGHTYAAGLTLDLANVEAFKDRFEEVVSGSITEELLIPQISVESEISLEQVNYKFYNILKQMEPFGPGNRTPVFMASKVFISHRPTIMKEKHVKMILRQEGNSRGYQALGFDMAEKAEELDNGILFDILFTIQENEYMGVSSLVLHLKDIRL